MMIGSNVGIERILLNHMLNTQIKYATYHLHIMSIEIKRYHTILKNGKRKKPQYNENFFLKSENARSIDCSVNDYILTENGIMDACNSFICVYKHT